MDKQKLIIIGAAFIIFVLVSLVIVLIMGNNESEVEQVRYTLDFPLLLPKEPGYSGEYLFANTPRARWTEDEVSEWFTIPKDENLKRLSIANEQVIKKILEAAP